LFLFENNKFGFSTEIISDLDNRLNYALGISETSIEHCNLFLTDIKQNRFAVMLGLLLILINETTKFLFRSIFQLVYLKTIVHNYVSKKV